MSVAMTLGPIGTRRKPPAKAKSMQFSIYLPLDLMERIDAWRYQQYVPPPRVAVFRQIVQEFLERVEKK